MPRTYYLKAFGCQMNKHDGEKIAGLLQQHGMQPVTAPADADVIVFLTCCVREKADERLYGQVSSLKALKTADGAGPLIAVGGCIGQRDGEALLARIPHIDVVFGTYNLAHLPELLAAAEKKRSPQVEILAERSEDDEGASIPLAPETTYHAWLPITVGCDNYCSYCVVPYVRGREGSHEFDALVEQADRLVAQGYREITLLGQNVNSYGRDRYGAPRFAELLEAVAQSGISRLGFTTSHPKDLSEDTIAVMAANPNILRCLHLPLQSGSSRVLQAMNRRYTQQEYLALVERIYAALPDSALSTDIIVGFPGETEADFADTLEVVQRARFSSAFTFLFSKRAGTPAAQMPGQVDSAVAQQRFDRLVEAIQQQAYDFNAQLVGEHASVLLEGASKRNPEVLVGRDRHYRVVHIPLPENTLADEWVGREVNAVISEAHTWYVTAELTAPSTAVQEPSGAPADTEVSGATREQ